MIGRGQRAPIQSKQYASIRNAISRVKVPPSSTAKCGLRPRACVRDWILESRAYYEEFAAKDKTETEPSPLHAVQKRPAQGQGEDGAALPGDDPGEERTITILRVERACLSLSIHPIHS